MMSALHNISSLSFQLFILSNLTNLTIGLTTYKERIKTTHMRLVGNCSSHLVRLDHYDRVELTSNVWPVKDELVESGTLCTAHFMTGNPDQGICIFNNDMYFKREDPGVQIKVFTSKLGPERTFNFFHPRFKKWCTEEPLVSIEMTTRRDFLNQNGEYRYSFKLSNVSKDSISKDYTMDSFKECNLSHELAPGDEVRIHGQRYPAPDDMPSTCLLNFTTSSTEEYEEICIQLESHKAIHNCATLLTVDGLNERFWASSEVLGCNDSYTYLRGMEEVCTKGKKLTLNLTRVNPGGDTGMTFTAVVQVKWHPFWKVLSDEESQLRGLSFIKGLVYFVACIDSVLGIGAAILINMIRNPKSFWKNWAESFVAAPKHEAVHYEGKFEVNYPEVSGCQVEEIGEAKAY